MFHFLFPWFFICIAFSIFTTSFALAFLLVLLGGLVVTWVADSAKWNCLDPQFSQNNHRCCVKWKQGYFGWQEVDWRAEPKRERKVTHSFYFSLPSKLLNLADLCRNCVGISCQFTWLFLHLLYDSTLSWNEFNGQSKVIWQRREKLHGSRGRPTVMNLDRGKTFWNVFLFLFGTSCNTSYLGSLILCFERWFLCTPALLMYFHLDSWDFLQVSFLINCFYINLPTQYGYPISHF